jgi:regulator of sigma E protease
VALIIFIVILSILIIVHEVGHFAVARFFGIRVDEFGLGYPPKAKKLFSWRGTDFTLNWLPFGGFVKIFGEDGVDQEEQNLSSDSFVAKNRGIQASVLVAGVVMNFVFAWFLISLGFLVGMPSPATESFPIENAQTTITAVLPNSPAQIAGLKPGDVVFSANRDGVFAGETAGEVADFIATGEGPMTFNILRGGETESINVSPEFSNDFGKPVIGVAMDEIGIAKLPIHQAVWQGLKTSIELTFYTAQALWTLISDALRGNPNLAGLAGPVGLVGIVGDASILGFAYLISLTALISINLVLVNLLPFPALDGGRLLFVLVESVSRKKIPPQVGNVLNNLGFLLLILLMVLVTIQDIRNIL